MFPLEHDGHFLMSIALGGVFGGPVLDEVTAAQRGRGSVLEEANPANLARALYFMGVLGETRGVRYVAEGYGPGVEVFSDGVLVELAAALLLVGDEEDAESLCTEVMGRVPRVRGTLARIAARRGDLVSARSQVARAVSAADSDLALRRLQWRLDEPGPYQDRYPQRAEAVGLALEFGLELRERLQNAHGWAIDDVLIGLSQRARTLDPLYPDELLLRVEAAVTGG